MPAAGIVDSLPRAEVTCEATAEVEAETSAADELAAVEHCDAADEDAELPLCGAAPTVPHIVLFDYADLLKVVDGAGGRTTDHDVRRRNEAVVARLRKTGPERLLHLLPPNWQAQLDTVQTDYPHFSEFLDYLRTMCALAAADNSVVELDWALLDGAPGTGKSTVVQRLAGLVGADFHRISMASVESGAHIGGSQEFWLNTKTGAVFATLTEGLYANPILLLDEIDKTSGDGRFDPLGPLYELLEPALAKHFRDLSIPALPIDASRVVWIGTSNDADCIPEAIRQRFVVFRIPLPTPVQALAVARSVLRVMQARNPRLRAFTLDADAMQSLCGHAPREMKKRIHLACGRAALEGRTTLVGADFPPAAPSARRMGF